MSILRGAGILWRSIYAVIVELSGGNGRLLFSIEGHEHQLMNVLSCRRPLHLRCLMDYVTSSSLKAIQSRMNLLQFLCPLLIMSNSAEGNLCASIESLEIDQTENLDYLLECYLDLLDQYTKLRSQLSQHLSAVSFQPPVPGHIRF